MSITVAVFSIELLVIPEGTVGSAGNICMVFEVLKLPTPSAFFEHIYWYIIKIYSKYPIYCTMFFNFYKGVMSYLIVFFFGAM